MDNLMKKITGFLFFMVMMLSLTASLAELIGVSHGSVEAGSKVSISWDSFDGADHYEVSVRDTSTDELLAEHKSTSKTSYSVKADWVKSGHTYRVWVGAYDDSGNILADGQAMGRTEFSVSSCDHSKTKEKVVQSWFQQSGTSNPESTHLYVEIYDRVCKNCGVAVESSIREETPEKHDFSGGKCKDCGYVCQHGSQSRHVLSSNFVSVSDSQHEFSEEVQFTCDYCGMDCETRTESKTLDHKFDSDGDCTVCNYRFTCKHSQQNLVQTSRKCNPVDEKRHEYVEYYDRVCANPKCGKVLEPNADQKRTKEEHTFNSSNVCTACGYQKSLDPLSVSAMRGQSSAETGTVISASASASGGDGIYQYAWSVYRGDSKVDEAEYGRDAQYSYRPSSSGEYTFKVTVKDSSGNKESAKTSKITVTEPACQHTAYADKEISTVSYSNYSSQNHIRTVEYARVCVICGETLQTFKSDVTEPHNFQNGKCVCGMTNYTPVPDVTPCPHNNVVKNGEISRTVTNTGSADHHTVSIVYSMVCKDCGEQQANKEEHTTESHRLNSDGICEDCGFVKVDSSSADDHQNNRKEYTSNEKYADYDDSQHMVTRTYNVICNVCGIVVRKDQTETKFENHSFDSNQLCTRCGHQGHVHTWQTRQQISSNPGYVNLNETSHYVNMNVWQECTSCGKTTAPVTQQVLENHAYTNMLHVQTLHEQNGHAVFVKCPCGAAKMTGSYQTLNSCSICNKNNQKSEQTPEPEETEEPEEPEKTEENKNSYLKEANTPGTDLNSLYYEDIPDLNNGNEASQSGDVYRIIVNDMLDKHTNLLEVLPETGYNVLNETDWDELDSQVVETILYEYVGREKHDVDYYYGLLLSDDEELVTEIYGLNSKTYEDVILSTMDLVRKFAAIDNATDGEKRTFSYLAADYINTWTALNELEKSLGSEYTEACENMKEKLTEATTNNFAQITSEDENERKEAWKAYGEDITKIIAEFATDKAAEAAEVYIEAVNNTLISEGQTLSAEVAEKYAVSQVVSEVGSGIDNGFSILSGIKIGNLLTPEAGTLIGAENTIMALDPHEGNFKTQMRLALNSDNSEDLYMKTRLFLITRKIGLEQAIAGYGQDAVGGENTRAALENEKAEVEQLLQEIDDIYYNRTSTNTSSTGSNTTGTTADSTKQQQKKDADQKLNDLLNGGNSGSTSTGSSTKQQQKADADQKLQDLLN